MNICRAFDLWNKPSFFHPDNPADRGFSDECEYIHREESSVETLSNVVQLATGNPLDAPAGLSNSISTASSERTQPRGLFDAPELQSFFAENHFGLGRHNGALYKSHEALELGCQNLAARFQNTLEQLVAHRQAKVDELRHMALQTQGMCATITGQIDFACQRLERDIATLQVQAELASEGKGWILRALNEYKAGFQKGLREAVDMALLG